MSDQMTTNRIERFEPHATDDDLAALRARLTSARLPERATTPPDAQGRDR